MASMHLFESVDLAQCVFVSSPGHTFNQILPSSNRKLTMGGFPSISALCVLKIQNLIGYDTVSDVVESKVHQCQQNSDALQDGLIFPQEISFEAFDV